MAASNKSQKVIVGAGLVGSLLALSLARRGIKIDVYERRPDPRLVSKDTGKSINLALSSRGIKALRSAGIGDEFMKILIPMKGRRIHYIDGTSAFQQYGMNEFEVINSISRATLNKFLLNLADETGFVTFHFNHKCIGIDYRSSTIELVETASNTRKLVHTDLIFGTDGSASILRRSMLHRGRFNYSQQYLDHGYKELEIPSGANSGFLIEKNALHIWPRNSFMLIALPNVDGSFTLTLFLSHIGGKFNFAMLNNEEAVSEFFHSQFPDLIPLIPNLIADFFENPIGNLGTFRCEPWNVNGKLVLLGDAAHAIVPFYGHGMNCGFEDVFVLMELYDKHGEDWDHIFSLFSSSRKPNADAIADLSLENFIEMRNRVADEKFLLRRAVEKKLYEKYPGRIISKYSLVSFNPEIPYHIAKKKGEILEEILTETCKDINTVEEFDVDETFDKIELKYASLGL